MCDVRQLAVRPAATSTLSMAEQAAAEWPQRRSADLSALLVEVVRAAVCWPIE